MTNFILSVFLLLITPGPGVLSTAGVGAGYGKAAGVRYVTGLFIGTNLVALAVVSGLAALMFSVPWLRLVLSIASALYLLSLAFRIATAGSKIAFMESKQQPGIIDGIVLQAINPKAYAVNTALFSGFAFGADSLLLETLVKFAIINAIWVPIHLLWLGIGISLKKLALSESTQQKINFAMAAAMIGVVVLALYSASSTY